MTTMTLMDQLAISPICNPEFSLEEALRAYANLGFKHFEIHNAPGVGAKFLPDGDVPGFLALARKHGMDYTSFHLPVVKDEASFRAALEAARQAERLGCEALLFRAPTVEAYGEWLPRFLDETDGLKPFVVVTNHKNTAISNLDDYREVLQRVDDSRLRCLLEVGHFHAVGIRWEEGYELLKGKVGLVHIKDIKDGSSVPYGQGEVDFGKLLRTLADDGYRGRIVVELEGNQDEGSTEQLAAAVEHLKSCAVRS